MDQNLRQNGKLTAKEEMRNCCRSDSGREIVVTEACQVMRDACARCIVRLNV